MISAINGVNVAQRISMPAFRSSRIFSVNEVDCFIPSTNVLDGNLKKEDAEKILKETENLKNCIGSGYTAYVYKIGENAVKSPRTDHSDKFWINVGNDKILKEYSILKEISKTSPDIAVQPKGLIQKKGLYHIVEEFIEGYHPYDNKMNETHLKDLIGKLTKLDKNGIYNSDLQSANIFFLKDGSSKLIDFGSYSFLANGGVTISSDSLPIEYYKEQGKIGLDKLVNSGIESRFASSFFIKNEMDVACDLKNYADNPYLNTKSNISNFEFRNLFTFLKEDYVKNPMETLKTYVKAKGEIYHTKMYDFLKNINIDENDIYIKMNKEKTTKTIQQAKEDLKKAIRYEELAKEVLSNPTEEVLKAETAKIQLKMFLNPDSWHSSIPHEKGLQDAYNRTIQILKENITKTGGNIQEYFKESLSGIQERFKNIVFEDGQTKIPDKENIIKILFPENQNTKIPAKNNNLAKIIIPATFFLSTTGFIKYQYDKQNKNVKTS